MKTEDLIRGLSADASAPALPLDRAWRDALALALLAAGLLFFVFLGPRPDIGAAAETIRFLFKFVVTVSLAAAAFVCLRLLSRPGEKPGRAMPLIAVAPALMLAGVVLEIVSAPPDALGALWLGDNIFVCLAYVPLIGLGPLGLFLAALRHGAPTRPGLAGAVAGLLAGGIAATFYAAHCTDDSPLFVASWYSAAIAILAIAGAIGGRAFARW